MSVEWTERWQLSERGIDQLGMRVAGERAYSQLLDFTTTVAWRARYFSFLCWSLERAYQHATRAKGAAGTEVNPVKWRATVKSLDYLLAAATLEVDPSATRIAGSTQVSAALGDLASAPETKVPNPADHLEASAGSHSIYAGPMRLLGLLRRADDIRVERPAEGAGLRLAQAFQRSMDAAEVALVPDGAVTRSELKSLGTYCSLSGLAPKGTTEAPPQVVLEERSALRDVVVDWANFGAGKGPSAPRLLTIGLILHVHQLTAGPATLEDFRAAILLDGLRAGDETRALKLPSIYDTVRAQWRVYQAHAYASYALECLLCLLVDQAMTIQTTLGSSPAQSVLIEGLLSSVHEGAQTRSAAVIEGEWWTAPVRAVTKQLAEVARLKCAAPAAEPELYASLWPRMRGGAASDLPGCFHDSCVLLLLALVRLRELHQAHGASAWIGDSSPLRLPPQHLVRFLDDSEAADLSATALLRTALQEFVVAQHRSNSLRKAAGDAGRFLPKFVTEGRLLVPIERHEPGTSNPRFSNATVFLADLGYLHSAPLVGVTEDGHALLEQLASGGPA